MRRRQFLKAIPAVAAVALLPTGYTEEVWMNNIVTLGDIPDKLDILFQDDLAQVGDYYTVIDCHGESVYEVYERVRKQVRLRPV